LLTDFNVEGLVFEYKAVFSRFLFIIGQYSGEEKIFKTQFICNLVIWNIQ